jgi:hypothetical protein
MLDRQTLDEILTAQIIVAWAGEKPHLNWWRSELTDGLRAGEFFEEFLPNTGAWASLQGARAGAIKHDEKQRAKWATPHFLITLFHTGFETDEQLNDRLIELKMSGKPPERALPKLSKIITARDLDKQILIEWLLANGAVKTQNDNAVGSRLTGAPPDQPARTQQLLAALGHLPPTYPTPHYRLTS